MRVAVTVAVLLSGCVGFTNPDAGSGSGGGTAATGGGSPTGGGSTSGGGSATGGGLPNGTPPTITYGLVTESNAGMDGCMAWQSVFLLNDGRIASFGTGNHAPEQSNAMRIIDPIAMPGQLTTYDAFPWTQAMSPPNLNTGSNTYVSNYDNHPSIYLPPENKAVWAGHGVFDFASNGWTYGDRPPLTQQWNAFLADARGGMHTTYNPAVAWCESLGVGVWFGSSNGGYGRLANELNVIERSDAGASAPWMITIAGIGGIDDLHYARDSAVCIGDSLFVWGPVDTDPYSGQRFYEINVRTRTLTATLANPNNDDRNHFQQLVHDPVRNQLVLIGKRVQSFNLSTRTWADVTPMNWPGFTSVNGVYHPGEDAIFFRGTPPMQSDCMKWNKMKF